MLARLKSSPAPDFDKLLVVPQKPATIAEAEEAFRKATTAREEGQQRHIEAGRRLQNQPLGQPPTIRHADVEELGLALEPLFEAEAIAKARRDEEVAMFEQSIGPSLDEPLREYRQAVDRALTDLETLLRQGASFAAKARQARFELKEFSRLPGTCELMLDRVDFVRKAFDRT